MEFEPIVKVGSQAELLGIRVDELTQAAQERQERIVQARQSARHVIELAGADLPPSLKQELERYGYSSKSTADTERGLAEHEQQAKQEVFGLLRSDSLAENGTYIVRQREHVDYDMAGSFEAFYTWRLTKENTLFLLNKVTHERGGTHNRGRFDEIVDDTTILFSESLDKPLVSTEQQPNSLADIGAKVAFETFKLGRWKELLYQIREFNYMRQCDNLVDECVEILKKFEWQPGRWPEDEVKHMQLNDLWEVVLVRYKENQQMKIAKISQKVGDTWKNVALRVDEGIFQAWSLPTSYNQQANLNIFHNHLQTVKALLTNKD